METIDKLIFNSLVSKTGIHLPKIGSLTLVSVPPKDLGSGKLSAPYLKVEYSSKKVESLPNVRDLLEQNGDSAAKENYESWLKASTKDASHYVIAGVGEIRSKFFYPSKELSSVLGIPEQVTLAKKSTNKMAIVLVALLAVAVILGIALLSSPKMPKVKEQPKVEKVKPVTPPVQQKVVAKKEVIEIPKNYHLIVGSFKREANAKRMLASNPDYYLLTPEPGRMLVAVYPAQTLTQAWNMMKKLNKNNPEIWVYKSK